MDSFEIEQEGGAIPEPVSQSVCEGNSSIEVVHVHVYLYNNVT